MSLEKFCYMKRIVQFSVLVCFFIGFNLSCSTSEQDGAGGKLPVPDYAQSEMWYRSLEGAANKAVDVFYITPTCIWDWKDQSGQTIHYMDVTNSAQRSLVDGSNALAYALFEKSCNFYSPYYRQITMNSWFESEEVINERYAVAHQDVVRAFKYYLEHYNNGRPFILAGHSQGAKAVIELLKHSVTPEQYQRMVAAYAFGFSVGSNELAQSPLLKPASGADADGVQPLLGDAKRRRKQQSAPLLFDCVHNHQHSTRLVVCGHLGSQRHSDSHGNGKRNFGFALRVLHQKESVRPSRHSQGNQI